MKEQNAQMCYTHRKLKGIMLLSPGLLEQEKASTVPTDGWNNHGWWVRVWRVSNKLFSEKQKITIPSNDTLSEVSNYR